MRIRHFVIAWFIAACPEKASVPDAGGSRKTRPVEPKAGTPCVIPTKPPMPVVEDQATCVQLGGTWVDGWDPKASGNWTPRAPDGGIMITGWQVIGRGNRRFRGCSGLPAPDRGEACEYDFQCLGGCESGTCAAVVVPRNGLGCGPHCRDGVLDTRCYE